MTPILLALVLGLPLLIVMARAIVVVPPGSVYLVERLGRFDRVLQPGMHVIVPFLSRVSARIPMGEQTIDVAPVDASARDGTGAGVKGSVRFLVADPVRATTDVADYKAALVESTRSRWLSAIQQSELLGLIDAVRACEATIREAAATWGLDVVEVAPHFTLDDESVRRTRALAAGERNARVATWLRDRREPLGSDGQPSASQHAAYEAWLAQEVAAHRDAIADAREEAERAATDERDRQREALRDLAPATSGTPFDTDQPVEAATLSGQFAVARSTIAPGETGTVEIGGRTSLALNESSVAILNGFRCVIERQDGDTLVVGPM